jgi:ribosomal protein L12E/L44/L45/RPP1/RPP2
MYNTDVPPKSELPSARVLLRSTLIAVATAAALLVTVVLPAEYGVDPTRVGRVLGLTEMGEIKMALAREAAAAEAAEAAAAASQATAPAAEPLAAEPEAEEAQDEGMRSDEVTVTLEPAQGREIKLAMREGAQVEYVWSVAGGVVNHDTHGDRPGTSYHGYARGTAMASDEGVLVAAFDGMHGWFWRNRGTEPVTVTLRVRGEYTEWREVE